MRRGRAGVTPALGPTTIFMFLLSISLLLTVHADTIRAECEKARWMNGRAAAAREAKKHAHAVVLGAVAYAQGEDADGRRVAITDKTTVTACFPVLRVVP